MAKRQEERIMTFRFRGPDLKRLAKAVNIMELNQTDVMRRLLVHGLASLELGEPLHQVVPSEVGKQEDAAE